MRKPEETRVNLNYCRRLGYLVSAAYWLPSDQGEFCVPGAVWVVGCSQLICTAFRQRVRQEEGFFGGGHAAKTFATQDWTTLKFLSHGPSWAGHRHYSCKCETHTEGSARPLDNSEDEGPLPPWKCAGHPLAVAGGRYYGVKVGPKIDWKALVAKAFGGWQAKEVGQETGHPYQALWLRGLYRRVLGTPMAGQLSTAIAGFLTHPDPMMRALALRFFYGQPAAPGGERLAELAEGDRALFSGIANPFPTDEPDLDAWLLGALAHRLALGATGDDGQRPAADRQELLRLARAESLRPGKAFPLVAALVRADTGWLIEHAPEIAHGTPAAAGEILIELDSQGEDVHLIAGKMARMPGFDIAPLRQVVKKFLEDESRRKTLAALSRAKRS
jgi:hypothetical protein